MKEIKMSSKMLTSMAVAGELIKRIKENPVLYDTTSGEYRNNELKEELWQKIASDLNEDVNDLKKRWRNLRDTLLKLLKSIKAAEKDPAAHAEAVRRYHKWVWAKEMHMFRHHLTHSKQLDINFGELPNPEATEASSAIPKQRVTRSSNELKKRKINYDSSPSPSPPPPKISKMKKIIKNEKVFPRSDTKIKARSSFDVEAAMPNEIFSTDLDATDRLFLAHAQTIKQFTARRQAITKLKIAEVVMEQEILHQEDVELASISTATARIIPNNKMYRPDSPPPFESVCGYDSDEGTLSTPKVERLSVNPDDADM